MSDFIAIFIYIITYIKIVLTAVFIGVHFLFTNSEYFLIWFLNHKKYGCNVILLCV